MERRTSGRRGGDSVRLRGSDDPDGRENGNVADGTDKIKIERAEDGTLTLSGLTPDHGWLIYSGLWQMLTEHDDAEAGQLGETISKHLSANGC